MKTKLINEDIRSDYSRNLLRARGIEDVDRFLNPTLDDLQDWRDLDNIQEGINIIESTPIGGHIAIIVDCDVDGFTSAAIISQYLRQLYPSMTIDHYLHDGKAHGLEEHWETIANQNYDLVIVPDAGSNDAEYAKEISARILIIDHHLVEDTNFPDNMCVINNQLSSKYRNKNLS